MAMILLLAIILGLGEQQHPLNFLSSASEIEEEMVEDEEVDIIVIDDEESAFS